MGGVSPETVEAGGGLDQARREKRRVIAIGKPPSVRSLEGSQRSSRGWLTCYRYQRDR